MALERKRSGLQIYFIQDFARAEWDGGAAERSGRWLYAFAAPLLRRLGHETVRIGVTHPAIQALLSRARALKRAGMALSWPTLFSNPDAASEHVSILPHLVHADLVVGFELSPNQMRVLEAANIRFIDVAIDAIRFEADLFLALRTNDPALAKAFCSYAAPVPQQAHRLRQRAGIPALDILFVGQTDTDAALVSDARLATIDPYLPNLRSRFGSGKRLLLKPHPYGRTNRDIRVMHGFFPEARIVDDNVYTRLASGTVAEVVTLSSGVATEAPFFGVPATSLLQPDTLRVDFVSPRIRVPPAAIWPGLSAMQTKTAVNRPVCHATLRSRLGTAWAFPAPLHLTDRRIEASDKLDFRYGGHERLLGFGWSHPEATGRWTDGPLATFLVNTGSQALELVVECIPYCPVGTKPLQVVIELRGTSKSAKRLTFHHHRSASILVRLPPSTALVEVVFHILNPRSTASIGDSQDDHRALGLHLTTIDVRARTAVGLTSLPQIARAMAASIIPAFIGG